MAIVNGWIDWAQRVDGPSEKKYPQANTGEWITCHSVVGDLPNHSIPSRFLMPYDPNNAWTQASVMFILYKDGHLIQMYPVTASTWTSGGPEANTRSWAIEAEGGGPSNTTEKLTPAASATFVKLVREWEARTGRKAIPNVTLLQHKDMKNLFGYAATACASDRYSEAWEQCLLVTDDCEEKYNELNEAVTKRLGLITLSADLNKYFEMLDLHAYATMKGYL